MRSDLRHVLLFLQKCQQKTNSCVVRDVLVAIDISTKTYNRIILNFVWAFGYNIIAVPIAGGLLYPWTSFVLPPWLAALAMVVSSISVLCSSLLLNVYRPPKKYLRKPLQNVVINDIQRDEN